MRNKNTKELGTIRPGNSGQMYAAITAMQPLLLSVGAAANALGISKRSTEYLIQRGELERRKVGRRTLVTTGSVRAFARANHPEALVPRRIETE